MAKLTIRERLVRALEQHGETRLASTSTRLKYTRRSWPLRDGRETYLWVGAAGSLRSGRTFAQSVPVDRLKALLLADPAEPKPDVVYHPQSRRIGEVKCGTSDAPDGAPRVIVQWDGGAEESKVVVAELRYANPDD